MGTNKVNSEKTKPHKKKIKSPKKKDCKISKTSLKTDKGNENTECLGLEKWVKEYNAKILGIDALREKNLQFLKEFTRKEEQEKRKQKNKADDDGWITVTKKGRNPGVSRKESVDTKLASKSIESKGLQNFYRFQLKESKMKHIENLRKQFEADKQKVNALRQARKFKPY